MGGSVFYSEDEPITKATITEVDNLHKELNGDQEAEMLETKLSSYVWICTSTHGASIVTVIDANDPAEILNSFGVSASYILCITSVPGASLNDYNDTSDKTATDVDSTNDKYQYSNTKNNDNSSDKKEEPTEKEDDEENVSGITTKNCINNRLNNLSS